MDMWNGWLLLMLKGIEQGATEAEKDSFIAFVAKYAEEMGDDERMKSSPPAS